MDILKISRLRHDSSLSELGKIVAKKKYFSNFYLKFFLMKKFNKVIHYL